MSEPSGTPAVTATLHGMTCLDCVRLREDLARMRAALTGACARYDHWYLNGASCEAGNMAYELVSAIRAALEGRG